MASILELPTEILLEIFSDNSLTPEDLARCQQTCRTFRGVTEHLKIDYTFKVDSTTQSTWRLARCLLMNPNMGNRFRSIKVTWHRRRPRKPRTWASQWHWTLAERKQIEDLTAEWLSSQTIYAIAAGLNSEAVLPFLLCFTPNLQSLDLGEAFEGFIYPTFTAREGIRVLEASSGNDWKWTPRGGWDDGWAYYDAVSEHTIPTGEALNPLWFHVNLDHKQWLPGLANLKHFAHSYKDHKDSNHFYLGWPANYLAKLLMLPRLETAQVHCCASIVFRQHHTLGELVDELLNKRFTPSVKRLEIHGSDFRQEDFEALAKLTGSLEHLEWSRVPESRLWHNISIIEAQVNKAFLARNKKLSPEQIVVVQREKSSEVDEEDQDDVSDLGTDDDRYYYVSDSSSEAEEDSDGEDEAEDEKDEEKKDDDE
ncbi:hypothetical protein ABW21_db0207653 [Orbilia brochopaga]|nr:hypothetical protein ABW21_db0207653 [Drechslerella brochopaga]